MYIYIVSNISLTSPTIIFFAFGTCNMVTLFKFLYFNITIWTYHEVIIPFTHSCTVPVLLTKETKLICTSSAHATFTLARAFCLGQIACTISSGTFNLIISFFDVPNSFGILQILYLVRVGIILNIATLVVF